MALTDPQRKVNMLLTEYGSAWHDALENGVDPMVSGPVSHVRQRLFTVLDLWVADAVAESIGVRDPAVPVLTVEEAVVREQLALAAWSTGYFDTLSVADFRAFCERLARRLSRKDGL